MMNRRVFLKNSGIVGLTGLLEPASILPSSLMNDELLYNGIQLPAVWPPRDISTDSAEPMKIPYLLKSPKIIPIDIGRQLFIDDFLIESTTLKRIFYQAKKLMNNPIFKPKTKIEEGRGNTPVACPKDGGVWWDPQDQIFKMWYEAGWLYSMAYAVSKDGINWERPALNIEPGTNRILPKLTHDSSTVFLDLYTKNPGERYKMFIRSPDTIPGSDEKIVTGFSMVSSDGIHWSKPLQTGICGDRSTIFYNPFRRKWIYSIRSYSKNGRDRKYHEHSDFLRGAAWKPNEPVFWTGADKLDLPDPDIGIKTELYNLSANAYESIMLGYYQIWLGPTNEDCMEKATPKTTDLKLAFSRDGFHWDRPHREAFIASSRKPGQWDRGYVQSVGGICNIVGDELWFYYIGFEGDESKKSTSPFENGMYSRGSTGIAKLRRDGFASMSAGIEGGTLTTKVLTFKGRYLFVNADCAEGELRVEVLDENYSPYPLYLYENCIPVSTNSTIWQIKWKDYDQLTSLAGKKVRFRFYLNNGSLFSFWVSPDKSGASYGYNAACGPGFSGPVDIEGKSAYKKAKSYSDI